MASTSSAEVKKGPVPSSLTRRMRDHGAADQDRRPHVSLSVAKTVRSPRLGLNLRSAKRPEIIKHATVTQDDLHQRSSCEPFGLRVGGPRGACGPPCRAGLVAPDADLVPDVDHLAVVPGPGADASVVLAGPPELAPALPEPSLRRSSRAHLRFLFGSGTQEAHMQRARGARRSPPVCRQFVLRRRGRSSIPEHRASGGWPMSARRTTREVYSSGRAKGASPRRRLTTQLAPRRTR
jgi:hypothetical protein